MSQEKGNGARNWSERDERNMREMVAALERQEAKHGELVLHLPFTTASQLIGTLQLALRHPYFPDDLKKEMVRLAEQLIGGISEGEPELFRILLLGFDSSSDLLCFDTDQGLTYSPAHPGQERWTVTEHERN